MPNVVKSVLVACPAAEMFALVDDCEHYPQFLPWCSNAVVFERELADGATVRVALEQARIAERFPQLGAIASLRAGIWSRLVALDAPLREGDRVEVYRALKADPKAMRRARVRRATRSRNAP